MPWTEVRQECFWTNHLKIYLTGVITLVEFGSDIF